MKLPILLCLLTWSATILADTCDRKKDSGDGVPPEYYIHECKGKRALSRNQAAEAEAHFREALAVRKFESPNYWLKVELAQALCLRGKQKEAKQEIDEFLCMASVDLNPAQCFTEPRKRNPSLSDSCFGLCDGLGGSLTEKGQADLRVRVVRAKRVLATCERPNPTAETDARKSGARGSP